jgi:lysozyme
VIGPRGLAIIKRLEGLRLDAYICPAGVPTIGYGSTHLVKMGDVCTEAEADAKLQQDLAAAESTISYQVEVPITESMRDALVSWVFNLGGGSFRISTLRRKLNALDYAACPEQIRRWNKAKDPKTGELVELPGLTERRDEEAKLFLEDGIPT